MTKKEYLPFDYTHEIKKEIAPLVQKIKKYCFENNIPFFFGIPLAENGADTTYYFDILSPGALDVALSNDKITKMINVMNNFDTVPPHKPLELDASMLIV